MVALLTMAFQMLARPQDVCLDVRVDEPRAEGGSGFYFPEQTPWLMKGSDGEFDARQVTVSLVKVSLPRLRGLLRPGDLQSPEKAIAAAQHAVDRVEIPVLRVSLIDGTCSVKGQRLPLTASQFVWYATLAVERRLGGDGWTHADSPTQAAILQGSPAPAWRDLESLPVFFMLLAKKGQLSTTLGMESSLRTMRSKARDAVRGFCRKHMPVHEGLLVPQIKSLPGGKRMQRIEMPAENIEIDDPHGWVAKPGQQ